MKNALAVRDVMPAGHPTPSEVAEHAGGILGSDLVRRFVDDYYNGREHDEGRSKLTHEQAEQIVASLEALPAGRTAQPPRQAGKPAGPAPKASSPEVAGQHYEVQADLDEAEAFGAAEAAAARERQERLRIEAQKAEAARQWAEKERLREEERAREEERRKTAEKERLRLEKERLQKEQLDREAKERLREEERAREEGRRKAAEKEGLRLEKERVQKERLDREAKERLHEEERAREEERRKAAEKASLRLEKIKADQLKREAAERERVRVEREKERLRQEQLDREAVERANEERRKADHARQNRTSQAAKWAELGHESFRSGDVRGAVTSFENALEWDPGNTSAQEGLTAVRANRSERPRDLPKSDEAVEVVQSDKREQKPEEKDETDADSGDKEFLEFFLGFVVGGAVLGLTYWLSESGLTLYPGGFMTQDRTPVSFWLFYFAASATLFMVRANVGGGKRSLRLYLRAIGWFCAMSLVVDPIVVRVLLHTQIDPLGWGFWLRFPLLTGATILIVALRTKRD